jgi:Zn-finger nucleic acid-binding protein
MVMVTFGGIEVDRCTGCQGIFFDGYEREQLRRLKGADSIDVGDAKVGAKFNRVDRIHCPRCHSQMIRMVDLEQPHIWFDHCTACGGAFFDAGEFKDLAHQTALDFVRDLTNKERN